VNGGNTPARTPFIMKQILEDVLYIGKTLYNGLKVTVMDIGTSDGSH